MLWVDCLDYFHKIEVKFDLFLMTVTLHWSLYTYSHFAYIYLGKKKSAIVEIGKMRIEIILLITYNFTEFNQIAHQFIWKV